MIKSTNFANIILNQTDRKKNSKNLFSFFFLSRSAVEGMDGSERKEKNERQQGAAERKRETMVPWEKRRGRCYRTNLRHYLIIKTSIMYKEKDYKMNFS